ncbi:MAG: N-acetylmuramoyl-L-alanine amidase [Eubacteriales bacterium]|nr:N-acetylmuramoyl-L-alanine amidase [Eubacteriales bacterium]
MMIKRGRSDKRRGRQQRWLCALAVSLIWCWGRAAVSLPAQAVSAMETAAETEIVTNRDTETDREAETKRGEENNQETEGKTEDGGETETAAEPGKGESVPDDDGDIVPDEPEAILHYHEWVQRDGRFYYYGEDGRMAVAQWIGERYVKNDGSRATNEELEIENRLYRFDADGNRLKQTKVNGYYYAADGHRVSRSWQKDPQTGIWNWFGNDGKQVFGRWIHDGKAWYYIEKSGDYARKRWQGSFYLWSSGKMAESAWVYDEQYRAWYYVGVDGVYLRRQEIEDRGAWFFLKADGRMAADEEIGGHVYDHNGRRLSKNWYWNPSLKQWRWYGEDGYQVSARWIHDGTAWYYILSNGDYQRGGWRSGYYLLADGKMAESRWIWDDTDQEWYYVKADGLYARSEMIDYSGSFYYLGADGRMAREYWHWNPQAKKWYWFDRSGRYDANTLRRPMGTKQKIVFLDPGHGGYDPGAMANGLVEKEMAFEVYRLTKAKLEANGYTVLSSRDDDRYVDFITERSRMANTSNADIFISLHFNAGGGNGIETYYYAGGYGSTPRINQLYHEDPQRISYSRMLAQALQTAVIGTSGANSRSVKDENYAVLRETEIPAVLIELGFLDNTWEAQKISQASYREKLAQGLFKGIQNYYSVLPQ